MALRDFFERNKIVKWKQDSVFNTEQMLPISEIKGDSIILKDGGMRAILRIDWLNLDLKNYDEQQLVLQQYKKFLNSLNFPLQILVRNTYLDLSDYIGYVKWQVWSIDNAVLKKSGEDYTQFLENIDLRTGLIYVKEFYIVVPYYPDGDDNNRVKKSWRSKLLDILNMKDSIEKIVSRYRIFLKHEKFLATRCAVVTDGLRSIGMNATRLWLSDIISLLFRVYNPSVHSAMGEYEGVRP